MPVFRCLCVCVWAGINVDSFSSSPGDTESRIQDLSREPVLQMTRVE